MSKYKAVPCQIGAEKYRSQREAQRHQQLLRLQRAGEISGLTREVKFELAPAVRIKGESRARPAVRYYLDFMYTTARGEVIAEDCKGMQTPVYRLKKHLMATVHGLHVRES